MLLLTAVPRLGLPPPAGLHISARSLVGRVLNALLCLRDLIPVLYILDPACCRPQERLPAVPAQLAALQQPDGHAQLHSVDVIPLLLACFETQPKPHSVVLLSGR